MKTTVETSSINPRRRSQGFTLLFAGLIASLTLTLATSIWLLAFTELRFSFIGRESQFAFFAADAGVECALYWDYQANGFATNTPSTITCNNESFPGMGGDGYGVASTFTLTFSPVSANVRPCAVVTVTKFASPDRTRVESRGYNTCNTTDSRRLERLLIVSF